MKSLTSENYGNAMKESGLAIVCFAASWCPHCRVMKASIEKVEGEYEGRARFYMCDLSEEKKLAMRFHISRIPTLVTFKNGVAINCQSGYLLEDALREKVDRLLKR